MNKCSARSAIAVAVLGLGIAAPVSAQPQRQPANDAPMPGPARPSVSTIPDKATPRSDNEAGPQTPAEHSRVTPPAGSAMAPNPKGAKSDNEASSSYPDPDTTQGGTAGSPGMGATHRSRDTGVNR